VDRFNGEGNDNIETNGEFRFVWQTLPECQVVFDVGANIGDWASLALQANPHLSLHCFEPSSATYQRLLAHKFPPSQVICNNFGLSSSPGDATLYVFEEGSGINSLYQRRGLEDGWGLTTQQHRERVRLETLDRYCHNTGVTTIDFLKVDVEGHEIEVFKGATAMLRQGGVKRIQFEYGGCNIDARLLLKDLFEFFQPFEYTFYKIFPHELRHVERYDQRLENFNYANYAVLRNDLDR